MLFFLSKTIGVLLVPSNLLMILAVIGLVFLATRWKRIGQGLATGGVLGLAILGLTPIGNILTVPLEQRFPPWDPSRGAPSGIIVLGGAINPEISMVRGTTSLGPAAERVTAVADLMRRYPEVSVVFSGGNSRLFGGGPAEAEYFTRLLQSFGIHSKRIRLEKRSRNTAENAAFSAEMISVQPSDRWLLITSAIHMPRAIGAFRRAGLSVEAFPVDWRTTGPQDIWSIPGSFASGLSGVDAATKEWIGLFVYWITGKSSELYPGPHATHRFAGREPKAAARP
jgi:uncharacterized SAM-binding protein YcdF (DUF218 family)